jgi:hypothetical protein
MKTAKLLLSVCALLAAALTSHAKGWRGIVPLHSTRADVERLIGKPNAEYERYDLGDERADIFYQRHVCSEGAQWDVPLDTVTGISVYPKKALRLADLRLDPGKYKKGGDSYSQGRTVYWNKEEGIAYHVSERSSRDDDRVMEIYYQPAAGDAHLRCPAPAKNTPGTGQTGGGPGPGGDACPEIILAGPPGGRCRDHLCSFSARLSGLDPNFTPTFKWEVSAGTINNGQGTYAIEVDTSDAKDKPVTVTVKVGSAIPDGCPSTKSYTLEPTKPSRAVSRAGACRDTR